MKLYFNGCSVTYGDELPENTRVATAWPTLVANHYNCEFFNDAMLGGTNGRTISHVLKYINDFDKFYIQWTHLQRFTLIDPTNWYEINFNPRLTHDGYKDKPQFSVFGKYYYTYWYHSLFGFKQWLENTILLQSLLKYHNKPYLMLSTGNNSYFMYAVDRETFISNLSKIMDITNISDDIILNQHAEIQNLLQQIDFQYFIPPTTFCIDDLAQVYPIGPRGHILEEGHRAVADYVIDYESKLL